MATLNRDAARAMNEGKVHAATDVTGFGLLGHLREMLRDGGIGARLMVSSIPALDGARELAAEGVVPGGTCKNLEAARGDLSSAAGVEEADRLLLADAQTSGGLLVATDPDSADRLVERLREVGTPAAAIVGEIVDSPGIQIEP
jgi:selenide,water dikinase